MMDRILKTVAVLGVVNFAAFIALDPILGGDALGGKVERGRYFLNNHGTLNEVSHTVFIYSTCHAYSALLGLAVAGFIGQHFNRRDR